MKKIKLLLAAALLLCTAGAWAQTALSDPTAIITSTFTALSGSYTIEVAGTADTEIQIPYNRYTSFKYTPTVTGTIRFISNGSVIFVYEKESSTYVYKGMISSYTEVTYPEVTNDDVSDAINLLGNPDFQTAGSSIATGKYQLGSPWDISDTSIYGEYGFREGNNDNSHDNSSDPDCFVWRTDGGYKDKYFYQAVTGLVANGKYKVRFRTAQNTNGPGIFSLRLGSTAGGAEYSKASITVEKGTAKVNTAELTTSSLETNSYFSVYNEANCNVDGTNNACCQIDYIMLYEANLATGVTGVSSAEYVLGAVFPYAAASYAAGDYYLFNEGAGKYVVGANNWGTRASMETSGIKMTATLSDGKYTLSTAPTYTGKYLGVDGYVDQVSAEWYFIPTSEDGYIMQCSSNGKYLVWDGSSATTTSMTTTIPSDSKGYWTLKTAADRFAVLETATKASPKEATYLIANPDFSRNANLGLWTSTSSNSGEFKVSGGDHINNNLQQWNGYCTVYQDVTNLPNGLYKLTVQGFYRPGGSNTTSTAQNVTIYAGDEEELLMLHTNGAPASEDTEHGFTADTGLGSWVPNTQEQASKAFAAGYYVNEVDNILTTSGTIQIGAKNTTELGYQWMVIDNFRLYYYGPTISSTATALPGGGLTADTWYYFDVAVNGDYDLTVTTLSDVVYTTDAKVLVEDEGDVTTNFAKKDVLFLTAGRYYIKSASAQSFAVAPHAYTYAVGDATLSVADDGYTQSSTFTVTFPDAVTNDPSGATALVASSKGTVNDNEVALSAVTNGFSLDLGELTANTDYVISIPAGVYGYADESMNAAIDIIIHTPVAFDGEYCLYDVDNSLFLGRGCQYGTEASVDKYGIPFNLVTDATGTSSVEFVDWTGVYLFITGSSIYTDNASTGWKLVPTTGGYYLRDSGLTIYATHAPGTNGEHVYTTATESEATIWTLKTKVERDAIVDAYPTDNKNNVITASGISTTPADFETYLGINYNAVDCTSEIGTATFAGSNGDWTWNETWRTQDGQPAYGTNFVEAWNATGAWTQTIDKANLPAGIYKVTVQGYERRKSNDAATALYEAGYNLVSTYLSANGEQVRFTDWNEVDGKPNSTGGAVTAFGAGEAVNEVYVYLDGNTDLDLTVRKPNYIWDCWVIMNNFTLTRYVLAESVTVTSAGYATYCSENALDFTGTGIEAYVGTISDKKLTFTPISQVPANTGLLLVAAGGTTEKIPVIASAPVASSCLTGVNTETTITADDYILNVVDGNAGFYKAGTFTTLGAHKAYISAATASSVKEFLPIEFSFDDPDGINSLIPALFEGEGAIYNVAGQRLNKVQKGINIVNGKKILK